MLHPHDPAAVPGDELSARVQAITRPERGLLGIYLVASLLSGPFFPIVFVPLFFKYHTLRYRFDDDGICVSWGILFRREHYLTYPRIQDIHVTRNLLERWLDLGKVSVQTASGSGAAEAEFVGVSAYDEIRDYLYGRMRGMRVPSVERTGAGAASSPTGADDVAEQLEEIRDALHALREHLETRGQEA